MQAGQFGFGQADVLPMRTRAAAKSMAPKTSMRGGGALCATILALKQPNDPTTGKPQLDRANSDVSKRTRPVVGVQLLMGMKPQGPNRWVGQAYNPEDGNIYPVTGTLANANTFNIQGCILGGMICRTYTWTRKPEPTARAN